MQQKSECVTNSNYAPIIVFAFNRLQTLKGTIESLQRNAEAKESDLFVFVDGARTNKQGESEKVRSVQEYVRTVGGFKSVTHVFSKENKGLAKSVIGGATEILKKYGKVIVVEDDLCISDSFLRFMNEMLIKFKDDERIMQVSGFSCKIALPKGYEWDAYLCGRAHSWTWGTWIDRWETVDWEVKDFSKLQASRRLQRDFCRWGSDLYGMLKGYMLGKNDSWYIRFEYAMHQQRRYAVCPVRSLVRNEGFTDEATHCTGYNRYKIDFESNHSGTYHIPQELIPVEKIMREAVKYWSIRYRIYGKIRTWVVKIAKKV